MIAKLPKIIGDAFVIFKTGWASLLTFLEKVDAASCNDLFNWLATLFKFFLIAKSSLKIFGNWTFCWLSTFWLGSGNASDNK